MPDTPFPKEGRELAPHLLHFAFCSPFALLMLAVTEPVRARFSPSLARGRRKSPAFPVGAWI